MRKTVTTRQGVVVLLIFISSGLRHRQLPDPGAQRTWAQAIVDANVPDLASTSPVAVKMVSTGCGLPRLRPSNAVEPGKSLGLEDLVLLLSCCGKVGRGRRAWRGRPVGKLASSQAWQGTRRVD